MGNRPQVGILRDVAAALAAVHGASPAPLVHRDLKMVDGMALTGPVEMVVVWGGQGGHGESSIQVARAASMSPVYEFTACRLGSSCEFALHPADAASVADAPDEQA
jgi:hypothetical protein